MKKNKKIIMLIIVLVLASLLIYYIVNKDSKQELPETWVNKVWEVQGLWVSKKEGDKRHWEINNWFIK